jgi:hypothetical protein
MNAIFFIVKKRKRISLPQIKITNKAIFLCILSRGGKVGMPAPFRPAQKRGNLGVRAQNPSPSVYWRACPPNTIFFFLQFELY